MNMKTSKPSHSLIRRALTKGVGGGISGGIGMSLQVGSLMWLRSAVSYQYYNGTSFPETLRIMRNQGGVRRFYRGFPQSIAIASLIRFGDVFANSGVMELLENRNISIPAKTFLSTCIATGWRVFLMPLDTQKTLYMVLGEKGNGIFFKKLRSFGFRGLYDGSLMQINAAFFTHYPWFLTYNFLYKRFPKCKSRLMRNGMIGFIASCVAVCTNNAFKVMKTHKQLSVKNISYRESLSQIRHISTGTQTCSEVLLRGLGTRILLCGIQGFLFTLTWKYLEERFRGKTPKY